MPHFFGICLVFVLINKPFVACSVATVVYFLEAFLQDYNEESDGISEGEEADHSMVNVGNGFFLYKGLHDKLYDYQREGVLWMWGLYKKHKGGILGDDMG